MLPPCRCHTDQLVVPHKGSSHALCIAGVLVQGGDVALLFGDLLARLLYTFGHICGECIKFFLFTFETCTKTTHYIILKVPHLSENLSGCR